MASFEFLAIVLTGLGLTASIIYYASILRNANKTQQMQLETRQAQLFMNIYNNFVRKEFTEDWFYVTFLRETKRMDFENSKDSAQLISVLAFFEGIGVLLKRKLISISLVDDLMSSYVILLWNKYGSLYREISRIENRPELWEHIHYLYEEIQKIYKKQYGHDFPVT